MNFSKKQSGILLLDKNKAVLYIAGLEKPFEINFAKTVMHNLEVIDKSAFTQAITEWIATNQIKPLSIVIILAKDVLFEKILENIPLSLQAVEAEKFLEMVPFHTILTKTYTFSNKAIVVAANREFCDSIVSAFGENQFPVMGILPLTILEEKFSKYKESFDPSFAIKKIDTLRNYFFPSNIDHSDKLFTYDVPSFKNAQFVGLISIFILLIIILGIQVFTQILAPVHTAKLKNTVIKKEIPSPTLTVIPTRVVSKSPSPSPVSGE